MEDTIFFKLYQLLTVMITKLMHYVKHQRIILMLIKEFMAFFLLTLSIVWGK